MCQTKSHKAHEFPWGASARKRRAPKVAGNTQVSDINEAMGHRGHTSTCRCLKWANQRHQPRKKEGAPIKGAAMSHGTPATSQTLHVQSTQTPDGRGPGGPPSCRAVHTRDQWEHAVSSAVSAIVVLPIIAHAVKHAAPREDAQVRMGMCKENQPPACPSSESAQGASTCHLKTSGTTSEATQQCPA